jgi:hypothetical protein
VSQQLHFSSLMHSTLPDTLLLHDGYLPNDWRRGGCKYIHTKDGIMRMTYKAQKGNDWHKIRIRIGSRRASWHYHWTGGAKQKWRYIKGFWLSAWLDTGVLGRTEWEWQHLILFLLSFGYLSLGERQLSFDGWCLLGVNGRGVRSAFTNRVELGFEYLTSVQLSAGLRVFGCFGRVMRL